ncbi:XRE family transcriptional regulator [Microcoleus sp. FACHB-SPT15]|nr:XRE family transcriptional regulator [Microcoleus sp. FACHB-SPT15]
MEQSESAALVREVRQRLRLSQEKFAHQLGVTCLTLERWKNGHSRIC